MLRIEFVNKKYGKFVCDPTRAGSADPIGINELVTSVKKGEDTAGIVFDITLDLGFILDAKPYITNCFFNDGGIDSLVLVNVLEYNPNTRSWELYNQSKVNFNKFDRDDDKITLSFEQRGPQTAIINGKDIDVDLETLVSADGTALPAQEVKNVAFHSKGILEQAIKETYYVALTDILLEAPARDPGAKAYFMYPLDRTEGKSQIPPFENLVDEIEVSVPMAMTCMPLGSGLPTDFIDQGIINYSFKNTGHISLNIQARFMLHVNTALFDFTIESFVIYGRPGAYTTQSLGVVNYHLLSDLKYSETNTIEFDPQVGDVILLYSELTPLTAITAFDLRFLVHPDEGPYKILMNQITTFPETTTKGVLLFEAVERTLQYLCNQVVILESTLLGRTDLGYDEDGEASLILWTNGNRIRGLNDKQIFANFSELFKFINANWCASWGVQLIDGVYTVLVEKIGFFFDKSVTSISFGELFGIETKLDPKLYFRQVKYGYSGGVNIKELNVIDEFNTGRLSELPLQNCKNILDVSTNTHTSGYEIEWLRRLAGTTQDSSNDDKNFAVSLIRDGLNYKTKKNEGYDYINNVYEPETGYNYDLSPGRALRRWLQYLSSSLIYSKSKVIKFSSGERNYLMYSKKTDEDFIVYENGNVDVTGILPIWDTFNYSIQSVPFSREFFKLLKQGVYGVIVFKDRKGATYKGFVNTEGLEINSSDGVAELRLLKTFEP